MEGIFANKVYVIVSLVGLGLGFILLFLTSLRHFGEPEPSTDKFLSTDLQRKTRYFKKLLERNTQICIACRKIDPVLYAALKNDFKKALEEGKKIAFIEGQVHSFMVGDKDDFYIAENPEQTIAIAVSNDKLLTNALRVRVRKLISLKYPITLVKV